MNLKIGQTSQLIQAQTQQTGQTDAIQKPITQQAGQTGVIEAPVLPVICPQPIVTGWQPLTAGQLSEVAGVGGVGIKGTGTLKGELAIQKMGRTDKAVLITAHKGSRSEVKFTLDIPLKEARARVGQEVEVEGRISKDAMWGGKIQKAKLSAAQGFAEGTYVSLKGRTEEMNIMGIGGEAPPSGTYLMLDKSISVGGNSYDRVYLGTYPAGQEVELHGRLDVGRFGGVEVRDGRYAALSGVSNLTAGEPRFDGENFITKAGEKAPVLMLDQREIYDAPNWVLVLDEAEKKAFQGGTGGRMIPGSNRFHGFYGQAAEIVQPTDADRAAVKIDRAGKPVNGAGEALKLVASNVWPPQGADQMMTSWYFDPTANTAYKFLSGGIAGFNMRMSEVIRVPTEE